MEPDEITPAAVEAPVVAPVVPVAVTPVSDADAFSAAFDELSAPVKPAEATVKPADAPEAKVAAAEVAAVAPVAPVEAKPVVAEPTLEEQLAALRAENETLKKTPPVAAPPTEVKPAPAAVEAKPIYTAEQQKEIDTYLATWPDIAKGEALVRGGEYAQVVNHIFASLKPVFDEVAQLREMVGSQSERTHFGDIVELVPDYIELRKPLLDWIDKQSPVAKSVYEQIGEKGTPTEIADMIGQFKAATKWVSTKAPAPATPTAPAAPVVPAAKTLALPAAVVAAAAALKPVAVSRTEPAASADPDDFAGAFAEFAKVG